MKKKIGSQDDRQSEVEKEYKNEVRIMARLKKHPNVVKILEFIDDPKESEALIVMEYIPGGPLMTIDGKGYLQVLKAVLVLIGLFTKCYI